MARLSVRFAGRSPFEVRVIDVAPRPGVPRVDRGALRRGARNEENEVSLDLPAGRYRLRLSAANAVEQRWVDLPARGARIFSDPPDDGPGTWRGALNVRSQRRARGDGRISVRAVGVLLYRGGEIDDDFLGALGFRRVQGEPNDSRVALDGFIALHDRPLNALDNPALARLRAHPAVAAAGPLHREGDDFSLFRAHLYVQFRSGVAPDIALGMLARLRGRGVKALRPAPRMYRVDFEPSLGVAINAYVAALVADHRVAFAEPGFGDRPVMHAPADFLWPMLWDRELLGIAAAHDIAGANAAVNVAVIDDAFSGVVEHPELAVGSAPTDTGNNHGMACMGLIGAVADAHGLIGVAPDAQLTPIIYSPTGEMAMSLAEAVGGDADVISASVGVRDHAPGVVEAELFASTRGRGGRGVAQFFSAGDDGATSLLAESFGSSEFGFATSGVSQAGLKLTGGNAGPEMAWCAPAGSEGAFPTNWATSAPDTGTLPGEQTWSLTVLEIDAANAHRCRVSGEIPVGYHSYLIPAVPTAASLPIRVLAVEDVQTVWIPSETVTSAGRRVWTGWMLLEGPVTVAVGDDYVLGACRLGTVSLGGAEGDQIFEASWNVPVSDVGDAVWIAHEASVSITRFSIASITGANDEVVTLTAPLDGDIYPGQAVFAMVQHARQFGSSSAANALAAGVGALALRANPELTWREVHAVLKESATSLGSANDFGAGRLNALGAVETAIEYSQVRADLHIRDSLGDQGDGPTAPLSPSPDIWVRNVSGPGPAVGYAQAGPHQDPIADQTNYVYVRIRNRGQRTSPPARVMLHVAASGLAPFDWPTAWTAGDTLTTRTIADAVDVPAVAPGDESLVEFVWPISEMLPDAKACLLAEITPQDGALAHPEVHRNTNLAIRPVSMIDGTGVGPQVVWRDSADDPLGFNTGPGSLTVRAHLPGGAVSYAAFHAHGRARGSDLPVALPVSSPSWSVAHDAYVFTVTIPADCAEFVLEAEVLDNLDRTAPSDQRFHRLAVRLPIELTLLLDYSGSMRASAGTESKWSAARKSAILFAHLFDQLSATGAAPVVDDALKVHWFFHTGGVSSTLGASIADLPLIDPPGAYATPLGQPILDSLADFSDPATPPVGDPALGARERVIVLLTDGKENRGKTLAEVRGDLPGNPTSVVDAPTGGLRIHACAFGAPGTVDTDALEGLVHGGDDPNLRHYDGRLQTTENLSDPDDAGALTEMFLSVLSDVTGVEMIGPLRGANSTFVIEDGVDMFMVIAPAGPNTLTLAGPSAPAATSVLGVPGYLQFKVTGNTTGTWTLNGTPATDCFVLVDLQLTSELAIEATVDGGFECAIRLLFAGQPITDARCELRARGPGESIGEAILNSRVRLDARYKGELSKRGRLVQGVVKRRNQKLRVAENLHVLQPTGAGRFATTLGGPLRTGTWSFELKITGATPSGQPFERLVRASRVIAAQPDATTSVVQWATLPNGKQQVVITPKDARGDRLGPGLDLSTLGQGVAQALVDRGDGTYAAVFDARQALTLSKRLGARTISAPPLRMHRVRITVESLRLTPVRGARAAAGEWVFVARAQMPGRRKSTRLPERGAFTLQPNTEVKPEGVIVDARLVEGERLALGLAGFRLDGGARWEKTLRYAGAGVRPAGTQSLRLAGDPRRWVGTHRIDGGDWQIEVRVEID